MRAEEFIREDAPEGLVIKHKPTPTGGAAVEAYIGNREVGFVQFQKLRDGNYKASMAHVSPSMRKQGIGREMYRYARNVLGFNIVPSDSQSDDARAFWSRGGATNEESGVSEGLVEARNSLFAWIKQQFPTWPDYVLKDFLYQQAKSLRNQAEIKDFLKRNKNDFGQVKWRLEQLPITMDIFTPKTQRMIISREGGSSNPFQVPKDAERHVQQSRMLQQTGVSKEPIIVAKLSNGYDLIEGWHRTIQHLKAFPEGYTAPAWVAYGATYTSESIEPGVAEGLMNESVIFLNPNAVIVGQDHSRPLNLSPETLKRVKAIAAKHGAWYEGNGADRAFTKGVIDNYVGSFDDDVAKIASADDPKWIYVLFANVDANNRVQRVGVDPADTIFNRLLATAKDNSFQGIGFTSQALKKFLSLASEGKYDFVKMSQQPATQENLTRFLKAGEALMWPSNWEQYPNRAGKIAKAATVDARDRFLASRKSGVYVVGSGHLKAIQQISGKQGVAENFADGRVKGKSRPGRVKRAGASCAGSVSDLRARAKRYGGEKGKMYHWCANMKSGKRK